MLSLSESGKIVRAKKFLPKGITDPYMCGEIFDILSAYEEFRIGRAYAIVSIDEKAAIYTFAPETMKKPIRFDGGQARLRLVGSKKYPFQCYGYPKSEDKGEGEVFHLAGVEVRIPPRP